MGLYDRWSLCKILSMLFYLQFPLSHVSADVLASMVPAMVKLWLSPYSFVDSLRCLTMCGWCSFLFGWHVHERPFDCDNSAGFSCCRTIKAEAKYFLLLSITKLSPFPSTIYKPGDFLKDIFVYFLQCSFYQTNQASTRWMVLTTAEKLLRSSHSGLSTVN